MFSFIVITAILTRLDGWGETRSSLGEAVTKFFGVWTCSIAVFLASYMLLPVNLVTAFIIGAGYALFRAPEMGDYWKPDFGYWPLGFMRGAITTLPTFVLLTLINQGHVYGGWLFLVMGLAWMLLYNGLQRYHRKYGFPYYHHVAEFGTGAIYAICVVGLV